MLNNLWSDYRLTLAVFCAMLGVSQRPPHLLLMNSLQVSQSEHQQIAPPNPLLSSLGEALRDLVHLGWLQLEPERLEQA